jgi:GNAT superfamily N-acetyltransferase
MAAPGHALLVADAGGALAGCIMAAAQRDFCTEAQGYIAKYYVRRAFRGGPAGRALIAAASAWFDANGVRCAFVAPLGRVGDRAQQMNVNLLAKHGFAPGGVLLVRDMDRCVQTPGLVSPPTLPSPARGEGTALHGRVGVAADVQGR